MNEARARFLEMVGGLRLPVMAAPMFLVSGPELVIATARAGVMAAFPTLNARPLSQLDDWLQQISTALDDDIAAASWVPNFVIHRSNPRAIDDLERVLAYRPPLVITALGKPTEVVKAVHSYGGLVFADVNSVSFARKAAEAGADGLVLVAAGAGGHTGQITGFAFVSAVREFFDGPLILAGGIMTGRAVLAAQVLGADLAYLGTRFIAARESLASDAYKQMLVDSQAEDVVLSDKFTGVPAHYLMPSITAAGIDLASYQKHEQIKIDHRDEHKAWRDIWSAGQGVGSITRIQSAAEIVEELAADYAAAREQLCE